MKTTLLISALVTFSFGISFAGTREELMARMGFSRDEIARDKANHAALVKAMDANSPKIESNLDKSDNGQAADTRPRTAQQIRDQAEAVVQEAENRQPLPR